eukprot:Lithocolla_globosa_v1_NODE_205_length_5183_cov_23.943448.p5 type:complete len:142 gc:universal NODE_205_length_5183_cov_23.943448:1574-1999(+)
MEVPEMVLIAVSEVCQAARMLLPGAKMSQQEPKLEKPERASRLSTAMTVKAPVARAGDMLQASLSKLPAATTLVIPAAAAELTASSTDWIAPPLIERLITSRLAVPWATTQLIPSITPDQAPVPSSPITLTATRLAALATP